MRNLKLGLILLLLAVVYGCEDQSTIEETQPTEVSIEGQQSVVDETPIPFYTTISIRFPEGYNQSRFMQANGELFGLVKAKRCPTNHNLQIWKINYMSYNELGDILNSILYDVTPMQGNTTSNGTGADPIHPPYRTRTAPPQPPGQPDREFSSEIWFYYGVDICEYD